MKSPIVRTTSQAPEIGIQRYAVLRSAGGNREVIAKRS